jgi:hypothetical protein
VPALHKAQVLEFQAAITVEYVPALHARQVLDRLTPVALEYFTAEHASQFTLFQLAGGVIWPGKAWVEFHPPSPKYPALHLQLYWYEFPAGDAVLAGHGYMLSNLHQLFGSHGMHLVPTR